MVCACIFLSLHTSLVLLEGIFHFPEPCISFPLPLRCGINVVRLQMLEFERPFLLTNPIPHLFSNVVVPPLF
jgi:hypothetical protein